MPALLFSFCLYVFVMSRVTNDRGAGFSLRRLKPPLSVTSDSARTLYWPQPFDARHRAS